MSRKTTRDSSIDFYRTIMMLGVCFIHSFGINGTMYSKAVSSALYFCVCGFIFISGYYGIRFRPSKIIELYGLGAFGAAVATIATRICCPDMCGSYPHRFMRIFCDYWFLNAYVVLMFLAPALNMIAERARTREGFVAALSIIVCTVGWSFIAQLPIVRSYIPQTPGVEGCSGFLFAGIYIFARVWKEFDFASQIRLSVWGGGGGGICGDIVNFHLSFAVWSIFFAVINLGRSFLFRMFPPL